MPEKFTFVLMEKLLLISVSVCEHLRLVAFSSRSLSLYLYIRPNDVSSVRWQMETAAAVPSIVKRMREKLPLQGSSPLWLMGTWEHHVEQHNKA